MPTDRYTANAYYEHWEEGQEISVYPLMSPKYTFAPRLGTAQLTCNQSGASFQVLNSREQLLEAGEFPATIREVPEGNYHLIASHHGNNVQRALYVRAGTTNTAEAEFRYGTAVLETVPAGATVTTANGRELGATPLRISEITEGQWQVQLRLSGYETVSAALDVVAQATNTFRTNLVNINYTHALSATRQSLSSGDYDAALKTVADALQVKPNDPDAMALQKEAAGKKHVRQARALGKQGDYISADRELELALQSLPDNEEARQLLADFTKREAEQLERLRLERLERPKKVFDAFVARTSDAELFESHELKSSKPVEQVQSAINSQLKGVQPVLQILRSELSEANIFRIDAKQEFAGGIRRCLIVGGQTKDDETEIFFNVQEYKTHHRVSVEGLLNFTDNVEYIPVHPSRIPDMTDKLKVQVAEGTRIVTERIQRAAGQNP
jgi:tetratricopeptide (TPR) repeat protein